MEKGLTLIAEQPVLEKDFKVYGTAEEPLFVAADVATWIEHSNTSEMLRTVDENEKLVSTIFRAGQVREVNMLTEDGLYEVLLQSRKPIAKKFKREVKTILKSIRKHGAYMTPETIEAAILNPDAMIKVLTTLKEERAARQALEGKVEEDRPKVLFADAVSASNTSILVGDLAKLIRQNGVEVGQNRLFQRLRDEGYLVKSGERRNMPTQKSMELGLFEVKETTVVNGDGSVRITRTPKVTGKGQQYFVNRYLQKN